MKRLFLLLLTVSGCLACLAQDDDQEPSAASQEYHSTRYYETTPPYGLEKVRQLIKDKITHREGKASTRAMSGPILYREGCIDPLVCGKGLPTTWSISNPLARDVMPACPRWTRRNASTPISPTLWAMVIGATMLLFTLPFPIRSCMPARTGILLVRWSSMLRTRR